jgi:hypothetical protein
MLWSCWERLSERSSGEFQAVVLLEKTVLELYIERDHKGSERLRGRHAGFGEKQSRRF